MTRLASQKRRAARPDNMVDTLIDGMSYLGLAGGSQETKPGGLLLKCKGRVTKRIGKAAQVLLGRKCYAAGHAPQALVRLAAPTVTAFSGHKWVFRANAIAVMAKGSRRVADGEKIRGTKKA